MAEVGLTSDSLIPGGYGRNEVALFVDRSQVDIIAVFFLNGEIWLDLQNISSRGKRWATTRERSSVELAF